MRNDQPKGVESKRSRKGKVLGLVMKEEGFPLPCENRSPVPHEQEMV